MKTKIFTILFLTTSLFFIFGFTMCHDKVKLVDPNSDILGFWVLEDDSSTKIEFLPNGVIKNYTDDVLESAYQYLITNIGPDGNLTGDLYLKMTFPEGDSFYYEINGINANNSGKLSLMTMNQGKIVVYKRP